MTFNLPRGIRDRFIVALAINGTLVTLNISICYSMPTRQAMYVNSSTPMRGAAVITGRCAPGG